MNASKEHILKIAFSLFLQKSFKAVTMNEIVKKTGLSKGAFYHYFSSKEELFNEIVQTYYLNLMSIRFEKLEQKTFKGFYETYIDYIADEFMELKNIIGDTNDDNDWNYYSLSFDAVNLFPNFKKKVEEHHVFELKVWTEAVERGKESGEINTTMDSMQVARMFVYSGDGIGLHLMQEGRVKLLENETLKLWNSFYSQIVAK